jgi:hypothetical protein
MTRRWPFTLVIAALGALAFARTAVNVRPRTHESAPRALAHPQIDPWFEPNRGQAPADVLFVADDGQVRLTADGAHLRGHGDGGAVDLALEWVDAQPTVRRGEDARPGLSHYYRGPDRSTWVTDVPHYGTVVYERAWPGIDAAIYHSGPNVEYDFRVAPHADPHAIHVRFPDAQHLNLARDGELSIETTQGVVHQRAPVAYQVSPTGRHPVSVRYALAGRNMVRFDVDAYDRGRALVIDPVLVFGSFTEFELTSIGGGVTTDAAGNTYFVGRSNQNDNDFDAFVLKWTPDGQLIYDVRLGSNKLGGIINYASGVAADAAGNAWVTGFSGMPDGDSRWFPRTADAFQTQSHGTDAFLLRLSPWGALQYATLLGGNGADVANAIALDPDGGVSVAGWTTSTDFPLQSPLQAANAGNRDAFIAKFDATGRQLQFATYLGGSGDDEALGLAVDSTGRHVIGGVTSSLNFPTKNGVGAGFRGGGIDGFLTTLTPSGTALDASMYVGGSGDDSVNSVALDSRGSVYASGMTTSTDFFGSHSRPGAFVVQANGGVPVHWSMLGDKGGSAIAVAPDGSVYVTGGTVTAAKLSSDLNGWDWLYGDHPGTTMATSAGGDVVVGLTGDQSVPTIKSTVFVPYLCGRCKSRAAVVRLASGTPTVDHEEDDPAVQYSGSWTSVAESSASGGRLQTTTEAGAKATITFTGNGVQVYGRRAPGGGHLSATLSDFDNLRYGANLNSDPAEPRALLFSFDGWRGGTHQLIISVTGDGAVWIDGFTALTSSPNPVATMPPDAPSPAPTITKTPYGGATPTAAPTATSTLTATATAVAATPTASPAGTATPGATASATAPSSAAPFGFFDTPQDGTTNVSGAIPVTGWALDDSSVARVEIYRDPVAGDAPPSPNGKIFIGVATFVPGARPDVAALYPTYPHAERAAWGYMLLTNMLPDIGAQKARGGNGTFTLYAYANDDAGNTTLLGARRFTAQNAGAVKPFGTIDTPAQGETVSGVINNFGWVLTPMPASVPTDGSTITLFIDGVAKGHAQYNLFRDDIAAIFPGYANTQGAVGFFSIDTRALSNGVHTLAWSVSDDGGHTEGIGSRYFTIAN